MSFCEVSQRKIASYKKGYGKVISKNGDSLYLAIKREAAIFNAMSEERPVSVIDKEGREKLMLRGYLRKPHE